MKRSNSKFPYDIRRRKSGEQNENALQIYQNLNEEERERFKFFNGINCTLKPNITRDLMLQNSPVGTSVRYQSAVLVSHAARLFTAELVEMARKLSPENSPLTPDVINIAFDIMTQRGKIPGKGPGVLKGNYRM